MQAASLEGKLAVVTGASRGIGAAVARAFACEGARLLLVARDPGPLEALSQAPGIASALCVSGDVGDPHLAERCAALAKAEGGADILVNAAGIFPTGLLQDTSDEMARQVMDANFFGAFHFCKAFLPAMTERGAGAVINISSLAARVPTPGLSVYAASKAALEAFTRSIATEVAPAVRVNCLAPGPTWTETVAQLAASDETGAVATVTSSIPMDRYGQPEEIADAALFLANSRAAQWMTGQTLHLNGGALMA